ncbi:hypothetical protein [Kitasatospora cathayae]|uniref:ABC transporter ATP-binding protein n=1 Tax=Kitasatospora cathayae TaxID=3004092 RepID=A0ABY7QC60_9ACTN|nr:hypothetical protein [Kitasatospora sp. HUAS 3-15]WBP90302.1 hypothetical protein O1G21_33560 [Kitasatospora sp. HUAS 3-15]
MSHAVTVSGLVKRYHPHAAAAVDGLSFTVDRARSSARSVRTGRGSPPPSAC